MSNLGGVYSTTTYPLFSFLTVEPLTFVGARFHHQTGICFDNLHVLLCEWTATSYGEALSSLSRFSLKPGVKQHVF